jgi:hypothetical protein
MTDTTQDTADELFDDAKAEFPSKFDLKDRLVLVWVTGKHGTRTASRPGAKPYDWYETYTLVLDDPNGVKDWNGQVYDGDKETFRETLAPSTAGGPVLLEKFQFSFTGMSARLAQRIVGDKPKSFKPMLGRINSRPNKVKGMAASWSVAEPTAEEKALAAGHAAKIREVSTLVEAAVNGPATDDEAFE